MGVHPDGRRARAGESGWPPRSSAGGAGVVRSDSYSGQGGDCVEVAGGVTGVVPVRDSKDPDGPALLFPADAWSSFLAGVKGGEFSTE
ncbi:DUF397 domain-containing protein [Kitasatospora sp. NPDC001660]